MKFAKKPGVALAGGAETFIIGEVEGPTNSLSLLRAWFLQRHLRPF